MVLGLAWDPFRVCEMFGSEYKSNRIRTSDSFSVFVFMSWGDQLVCYQTNLHNTRERRFGKSMSITDKISLDATSKALLLVYLLYFTSVTLFFSSIIGLQHSIATN